MADARDLKSRGTKVPYGFDSRSRHQQAKRLSIIQSNIAGQKALIARWVSAGKTSRCDVLASGGAKARRIATQIICEARRRCDASGAKR